MAKKANGFNLSETIREFRKSHRGASAREAMEAIKKSNPDQKINEGTFKSTFYKLAGSGKRSVRRAKPGRGGRGGDGSDVMRAGLTFIRLAGSVEAAREQLAGLKDLIETARTVD
ncbi:MAG TPA: hypothetical protein VGP76_15585 [Planctomycetaceae bacterium]|jgi:hypothetical protein|nr:hypothetical protein [Planctomycetaceae bacterium]